MYLSVGLGWATVWGVLFSGVNGAPTLPRHVAEAERADETGRVPDRVDDLEARIAELESLLGHPGAAASSGDEWFRKFTLGGYGEIHFNLGEGSAADQVDIHRMVIYLGYEFDDWLQLHSETEIEHAFVSDDDGEISIEQLHLDLLGSKAFNFRIGRVLAPLGIVNRKHEPPTFNGVERPLFDSVIVPSTWSLDGAGVFGNLAPELRYEAYVVAGLDGSRFNATSGIRGGRIKERPSLKEPAAVARFDYFPLARTAAPHGQTLRLGVSGYGGGIDNGDQGNNPGIDGELLIGSADFEYTIDRFDFRGAFAYQRITGSREIGNGTATDIWGAMIEAAVHVFPQSWKTGKLERSDLVVFARLDSVDLQYRIHDGVARNPAAERDEVTLGATFFFNPSLVFKADVQLGNDNAKGDRNTLINFGLGWEF